MITLSTPYPYIQYIFSELKREIHVSWDLSLSDALYFDPLYMYICMYNKLQQFFNLKWATMSRGTFYSPDI